IRGHQAVSSPLMDCIGQTRAVGERIKAQDLDGAMLLRGGSFRESFSILVTMLQAAPRPTPAGRRRFRLAVVHGGGPAPGMNTAVRAAVRLGLDRGYTVLAVNNGFRGLRDGGPPGMGGVGGSGWGGRAAVRVGRDRGYTVLAVNNGFRGLRDGDLQEMGWMSVSGWVSSGGADIGTNRYVPSGGAVPQTPQPLGAH